MSAVLASPREQKKWHEVLRRAAIALDGHRVGVWQANARGRLDLLATSSREDLASADAHQVEATLRQMGQLSRARPTARRWVATPLSGGWCVAPVRTEPPQPSPTGAERRGRERMTLELAGVCIGLLGEQRDGAFAEPRNASTLDEFVENVPVGVSRIAREGTILSANQTELDTLGYPREEYVGRNIVQVHADPGVAEDLLRRLWTGETVSNVQARLHHRDGSLRHVLISANAQREDGEIVHATCITRDITELRLAEEDLRMFKAMVDSADDAIVGKTLDGVITSWNAAAERLFGYTAAEMTGKHISVIVPQDRQAELPAIFESLRRGERIDHYETVRVRKDGTPVEVSITISPILDADGRPVGATAIKRDITQRKEAERQLLHGALHDALTDLPNRVLFAAQLAEALARARRDADYRFAVLFVDFDKFKEINDSLGHAAGDQFLVQIAQRLRMCVRPGDVVARLGGDEFAVLVEETIGLADAEHAARRIQDHLAKPFPLAGKEVLATASIGIVLNEPGHTEPEDLLRDADLAMYHAKEQGGGRFEVFDIAMRDSAQVREGMQADLRNAVERGEFGLVFQPIVVLDTGRIYGFEALLRWHHPARGVILPLEFMSLAEETGLILPIGTWVLREACRQARRWQDAFPAAAPVRISVNLSGKQLGHTGIVEDVRTALHETGLASSLLILDIAESVLMDGVESATALLHQLRKLDVELYLDGFGASPSSLSHLSRIPLQGIKIERSLVHRMGTRRTDLEIVRSLLDMTRALGLRAVAKGVETVAQRERLIAFGCELAQGHLFAKPLEPSDADTALRQARKLGQLSLVNVASPTGFEPVLPP